MLRPERPPWQRSLRVGGVSRLANALLEAEQPEMPAGSLEQPQNTVTAASS
jgi:hypothetical protein